MKRVILSTILLCGLAAAGSAQTTTGNSSRNTAAVSNTAKSKKGKAALQPSDTLNNRKIYHFKNGQRSTPTGHEATPSGLGGGYAAIGREKTPPASTPPVKKGKTKAVSKRSN